MAAEVVGTAFVRIRAITTGLSKEIERGVKKGAADAKVDKPGEDIGHRLNEAAIGGFRKDFTKFDKAGEDAGHRLSDAAVGGFRKDSNKQTDIFAQHFQDTLNASIKKGNFDAAGRLLSRKINDNFKLSFDKDFSAAIGSGNFDEAGRLLKKRAKLDDKGGEDAGDSFLGGLLRVFRNKGDGAGRESGANFGGGFGKGALLKVGAIAAPAITAAVSALLQYVVALVGQVGFLTTGLIGLGAAGGAAFGAVGLSALPLLLAFKATTPALETFKKRLGEVGHQWTEVGAATQQTLLSGLTYALNLSTKLIPDFRAFGRQVGEVVSFFVKWQANLLTSQNALIRMRGIMFGSIQILRNLASAAGDLIDIFLNLWASSILPAIDLSQSLAHITDRLQEITAEARNSGQLSITIRDWYERGKLVVGALADIVVGIFNILKIGANNAGSFFTTFDTFAANFRSFTESASGQNKLAAIFQQANAVAHEFNGLIGDIVKAIGGKVFDAGGADGIIGFIQVLRTDVVPFLDTFITQISSTYGPKLLELFQNFGKLLETLTKSGALGTILSSVNIALIILNDVLSTLLRIPGFDKFLGFLTGMLVTFKALKLLGLESVLKNLGGAILTFIGRTAAMESISGALAAAGAAIDSFLGAIAAGITLSGVGIFLAAIAAIALGAYLIKRNWSTIKKFFGGIFEFIKRNFLTIAEVVGAILLGPLGIGALIIIKNWDKVKGFFSKLPGIIGRALGALGGIIGSALATAFTAAFNFVTTKLPTILGKIIEFFAKLPFYIILSLIGLGQILIPVFVRAVEAVIGWLTGTALPAVLSFFAGLPERIGNALSTIGSFLLGIFTGAFDFVVGAVSSGIESVVGFFSALPGRIGSFLSALPERLGGFFTRARETVVGIVRGLVDDVSRFISQLPEKIRGIGESLFKAGSHIIGRLIDGIGNILSSGKDIAKQIVNGIIGFINSQVIKRINELLQFEINPPIGPTIKINPPDIPGIPKLATGAIVSRRPGGILANIGEGRYDEGVLPLPPGVIEGLQAIARGAGAGGRPIEVTVNEAHEDPRATAFRVATRLGDLVDR